MSITRDVLSFFKDAKGLCDTSEQRPACDGDAVNNMALPLTATSPLNIEELYKDIGTNIFDEIESLLGNSKISDVNENLLDYTLPPLTPSLNDLSDTIPNLDALLSNSNDFLKRATPPSNAVEQTELQPTTTPSGIYRRTDYNVVEITAHEECAVKNVCLLVYGNGCILPLAKFHNLYESANNEVEEPRQTDPKEVLKQFEVSGTPVVSEVQLASSEKTADTSKSNDLFDFAIKMHTLSPQDRIVIDRKLNRIVRTRCGTNLRTIYSFPIPKPVLRTEQQQKSNAQRLKPVKLKLPIPVGSNKRKEAASEAEPKPKRGALQQPQSKVEQQEKPTLPQPQIRSRSGRLVKLVQPALLKTLSHTAQSPIDNSHLTTAEVMRNLVSELKDKDYRCSVSNFRKPDVNTTVKNDDHSIPLATSSPAKRIFPQHSRCPTCKGVFLGRRLQRHFLNHPDHKQAAPPPNNSHSSEQCAPNEDMSLFRFLVSKLQKSHLGEDQRAELFLNEINDLVEQLQLRSSRLIRNTSGLHFVSARSARVLGIPEGQYALDMSAIEAPPPEPEPDAACMLNFGTLPAPSVNVRNLDYTALSMSLDDTLTDEAAQKLNLSAGGKLLPPSEESLLRAVDDFVHAGMKKLGESVLLSAPSNGSSGVAAIDTLMPHYDHASDNAVEAMTMKETNNDQHASGIIDLGVDFFQFNKRTRNNLEDNFK